MAGSDGIDMFSGICRFSADEPERFSASMASADFGDVRVNRMRSTAVTGTRTSRMLGDVMGSYVALGCVRAGTAGLEQDRTTILAKAGDVVYVDFGRSFELDLSDRSDVAFIYLPRTLLAAKSLDPRNLSGTVLSGSPLGVALAGLLEPLTAHEPTSSAEISLIEHAVVDLALAVVRQSSDRAGDPGDMTMGNRARVHRFIETNFADPGLNVDRVAAGINVSTRYLHKLMEGEDRTVYGLIRARRVRFGVELLSDPDHANLSIGQIARRSGFAGLSQFGRAVREVTGSTPREIRMGSWAAV
ncbi:helix-turn-helix domain-containing protein [Rhodococcus spelaei]|uniref:Helix-turn-helix domain-containing protein n=1 Tax=Rhodococcus spelaei TaxID=2546320 RepID=A0A541BPG7_9NOCA|nr:helix-turn-helix domain-containing protein [Rhodococcus spelaei]TQF74148.1 helix-turn-helix domain-containing protein [Rhodococcus spelaei]